MQKETIPNGDMDLQKRIKNTGIDKYMMYIYIILIIFTNFNYYLYLFLKIII